MKLLAFLPLLLSAASAWPVVIDWQADSSCAFAVSLSGTGLPWAQTITSPSQLWELKLYQGADYLQGGVRLGDNDYFIHANHIASVRFAGFSEAPLYTDPYNAYFAFTPFTTASAWTGPGGRWLTEGWSGISWFSVTSLPETDPASWTWIAQYSFSRPVATAEGGGLPCALIAGLALLAFNARQTFPKQTK